MWQEKESSMLRWLTLICDKKGTGMLSQLPAAADGGQRRESGFQELCFNCNSKACWNQMEVISVYWWYILDMERYIPHNFSLSIIYTGLNTSACIAGEYLLLSDNKKSLTHVWKVMKLKFAIANSYWFSWFVTILEQYLVLCSFYTWKMQSCDMCIPTYNKGYPECSENMCRHTQNALPGTGGNNKAWTSTGQGSTTIWGMYYQYCFLIHLYHSTEAKCLPNLMKIFTFPQCRKLGDTKWNWKWKLWDSQKLRILTSGVPYFNITIILGKKPQNMPFQSNSSWIIASSKISCLNLLAWKT